MKRFAFAAAILGIAAGAAQANDFRASMDKADYDQIFAVAEHTVQRRADKVLSAGDLANSPLSADDLVTVTRIPSSGVIDGPGRD